MQTKMFILWLIVILLSGCNLIGRNVSEPPLPTIVPVTYTPAVTATDSVAPQPTNSEQASQTETQPAGSEDTPEPAATHTPEPTPVSTVVITTPAEEPATSTPIPVPTQPPPTATPAASQIPALEELELNLIPVADGFIRPVFLTHAGDGTGRLFVVEQPGRILIMQNGAVNPTPFLDITSIVGSNANEQGLLSIAFHPNYAENGYFFVNYTNKQGNTIIARYLRSDNPDVAAPDSETILMTIEQPYANHNGGQIAFGPDGYLYIGMGDGGAGGDPQNRAQDLSTLLGKILRIDIDNAEPYGVPENNPFVGNNQARPEIWSYGWRNPWRLSFDSLSGDMYIADVGQNEFEEVNVERANTPGLNYGWRLMEGFHCFNPGECNPAELNVVLPLAEYNHGQGCSVTGGYVYRGTQFPALEGIYFYGDYCTGIIWATRLETDGNWSEAELLQSGKTISSFGKNETGEVYLVDHKGSIYQLGD